MSYSISIPRRVQKKLANLSDESFVRIRDSLRSLTHDPRPAGCKKLKGREGWRVRVGDYRVIYEINDEQQSIIILDIGHRRDIYQ